MSLSDAKQAGRRVGASWVFYWLKSLSHSSLTNGITTAKHPESLLLSYRPRPELVC
jgi:hypothetical protein